MGIAITVIIAFFGILAPFVSAEEVADATEKNQILKKFPLKVNLNPFNHRITHIHNISKILRQIFPR